MYESPIKLIVEDIRNQIVEQQEDAAYQAVLHYIPDIDKAELLRALQYDRDQYAKGYADGKQAVRDGLLRCKDCTHWGGVVFGNVCRRWSAPLAGMKNCTGPDDFCSYGERKDGE